MFAALTVTNFRLSLAGQAISLPGTWMQTVAQSWLVLQLTGSGAMLGLVAAAQFLPVLLGPYGGLVADRVNKRPTAGHPVHTGPAGPHPGASDGNPPGAAVDGLRRGGRPGHGQLGRSANPADVHSRDSGPRPSAERGQPEPRAPQPPLPNRPPPRAPPHPPP